MNQLDDGLDAFGLGPDSLTTSARDADVAIDGTAAVIYDLARDWVRLEPIKAVLIATAVVAVLTSLVTLVARR